MIGEHDSRYGASAQNAIAGLPVFDRVRELLVVHFGLTGKPISFSTRLDEDLALDSLDLVDFGMVLSDQFPVDLSAEMLRLPYTVGDLARLVAAALVDQVEKGSI